MASAALPIIILFALLLLVALGLDRGLSRLLDGPRRTARPLERQNRKGGR